MKPFCPHRIASPGCQSRRVAAFTLIEIMIVVGLIGLICTTAIPSIYQLSKKQGMRRAIGDLRDVCANARMQAIFSGQDVNVVFYPQQRRFFISGGGGAAPDPVTGETKSPPATQLPGTELTGIIPEDITLEMLDVNQSEYKDDESTWVRFFPNGTCDELTVVYASDKNERRWLVLEPATGLLMQSDTKP